MLRCKSCFFAGEGRAPLSFFKPGCSGSVPAEMRSSFHFGADCMRVLKTNKHGRRQRSAGERINLRGDGEKVNSEWAADFNRVFTL